MFSTIGKEDKHENTFHSLIPVSSVLKSSLRHLLISQVWPFIYQSFKYNSASQQHPSIWVCNSLLELVNIITFLERRTNPLKNNNKIFLKQTLEMLSPPLTPGWTSLVAQMEKNLPAMQETWVQSLSQEDSPREGNGNPLQYSCLENSLQRGAWRATGVAKSQTQLSS